MNPFQESEIFKISESNYHTIWFMKRLIQVTLGLSLLFIKSDGWGLQSRLIYWKLSLSRSASKNHIPQDMIYIVWCLFRRQLMLNKQLLQFALKELGWISNCEEKILHSKLNPLPKNQFCNTFVFIPFQMENLHHACCMCKSTFHCCWSLKKALVGPIVLFHKRNLGFEQQHWPIYRKWEYMVFWNLKIAQQEDIFLAFLA